MRKKKLVVIGGGAAGFFCAVNAASENLEVLLLEKTGKLLSKVKVSGGGRCNVTHNASSPNEMSKGYPRGEQFFKKAFHHFNYIDTIEWFESRGVQLKTEADGRMFPVTDNSETIMRCLLDEATNHKVDIRLNAGVAYVRNRELGWEIGLQNGEVIPADFVCIATGGFPKREQFDWMKDTGHTIIDPVPSLFTFNIPNHPITSLMGVSQNGIVKIKETKSFFQGPVLITHWGLSGPAVLKLSAFAARDLAAMKYECTVLVNWLPEHNDQTLRTLFQSFRTEHASKKVYNKPSLNIPTRLWELCVKECELKEDVRWADLPSKVMNKMIVWLTALELKVKGKTTFKEEFVTAGGIDLKEVDVNTMQSKLKPNLYFAGELLDVDGITGGYNFQNAWTTGMIAARSISVHAKSNV